MSKLKTVFSRFSPFLTLKPKVFSTSLQTTTRIIRWHTVTCVGSLVQLFSVIAASAAARCSMKDY